jgi:hypothetical protein
MTSFHKAPPLIVSRSGLIAVIAAGTVACGGEDTPETAAAAQDAASQEVQAEAVMELGEETYTFEGARCDLDDSFDDDLLVQASGTAPDGRRMTLEVERREVGETLHDRVTIYFGSITEGDHWNATANGQPGGSWMTAAGGEPLDGPLVVIDGETLTAEGTFEHETRDETLMGSLRVSCGG